MARESKTKKVVSFQNKVKVKIVPSVEDVDPDEGPIDIWWTKEEIDQFAATAQKYFKGSYLDDEAENPDDDLAPFEFELLCGLHPFFRGTQKTDGDSTLFW
eukprot:CAMPEP_0117858664 /NCGR_PEP_ID=MMETSP0950-20121206/2644_1 /TAXON_ID=44440 /ORGANISM="Chattonella subsalsa, Strain CCMP2191" /LENGTH=100 /DNA_ID=CAMNT_0005708333 /DNA_START=161 /DNA_END=460 /DNA_ORIENTATION=+